MIVGHQNTPIKNAAPPFPPLRTAFRPSNTRFARSSLQYLAILFNERGCKSLLRYVTQPAAHIHADEEYMKVKGKGEARRKSLR